MTERELMDFIERFRKELESGRWNEVFSGEPPKLGVLDEVANNAPISLRTATLAHIGLMKARLAVEVVNMEKRLEREREERRLRELNRWDRTCPHCGIHSNQEIRSCCMKGRIEDGGDPNAVPEGTIDNRTPVKPGGRKLSLGGKAIQAKPATRKR